MDRLDYLRRDSFFTGVTEGNIGSARIIKMLNVIDDSLVVEHKGIYSLENYLTTRRLMYWQVYLHRTCVAYEKVLINMLNRAKDLIRMGQQVFASPALLYFLANDVDKTWFDAHPEALTYYGELDDSDIWSAMKAWKHHDDKIRIRLLYGAFMWMCLTTTCFIFLQPQHYDILIRILIINTAPLLGHFLALTRTRQTNIAFFVIIAFTILITGYNLWM